MAGWGAGGTLYKPPPGAGSTPEGLPSVAGFQGPTMASNGLTVPSGTRVVQGGREPHVAAAPAGPWTPPPIPPSLYSPELDVKGAEGKQASEQTLTGDERTRTDTENQFGINLSLLGQREQQQAQSAQETLARLADSYRKLGVKQEENANGIGELNGGALIQSAMKRSANEAVTRKADEVARGNQQQQNANERGKLVLGEEQAVGTGGALTEAMANARQNQQQFQEGLQKYRASEAGAHGYKAPEAPKAAPARPAAPLMTTNGLTVPVGTRVVRSGREVLRRR
jgi:hypothetical protein